jgi:hypothetical protein
MSFINNLIDRAAQSVSDIRPRLRGKFERDITALDSFAENEKSAPDVGEPIVAPDIILPMPPRRTEDQSQQNEGVPDEPALERRQPLSGSRLTPPRQDEEPVQPVKRTRFEPSFNLVDTGRAVGEQMPVEMPGAPGNSTYLNSAVRAQSEHVNSESNTVRDIQPKDASPVLSIEPQKITVVKERQKDAPIPGPSRQSSTSEASPKAEFRQQVTPFMSRRPEVAVNTSINISIGRIEVRVSQPPAQLPSKPKAEGIPIMSLDEYLKKRNKVSK